ncbi:MAG: hypothetical protein SNF33_05820 [Candidatus Algichlamydia australiensis]|nr:hypothetical protein [Chlamydiales bacterium]
MNEVPKYLPPKEYKYSFEFIRKNQKIFIAASLTVVVAIMVFGSIEYFRLVLADKKKKRRATVTDLDAITPVLRAEADGYVASAEIRIKTYERIPTLIDRFKKLNQSLKGHENEFIECKALKSKREQVFAGFTQLENLFQRYFSEEYKPELNSTREWNFENMTEIEHFFEVKARRDRHTEKINEFFQSFRTHETDLLTIKATYERIMLMDSSENQ